MSISSSSIILLLLCFKFEIFLSNLAHSFLALFPSIYSKYEECIEFVSFLYEHVSEEITDKLWVLWLWLWFFILKKNLNFNIYFYKIYNCILN